MDVAKNVSPPLELILLVMGEKVREMLKIVCSAYQFAKSLAPTEVALYSV